MVVIYLFLLKSTTCSLIFDLLSGDNDLTWTGRFFCDLNTDLRGPNDFTLTRPVGSRHLTWTNPMGLGLALELKHKALECDLDMRDGYLTTTVSNAYLCSGRQ